MKTADTLRKDEIRTLLKVERDTDIALHQQINSKIRKLITSDKLPAGARLPGHKECAQLLNVNRLTISKVYSDLERDGLITQKRGKGTYINTEFPAPRQNSRLTIAIVRAELAEINTSPFTAYEIYEYSLGIELFCRQNNIKLEYFTIPPYELERLLREKKEQLDDYDAAIFIGNVYYPLVKYLHDSKFPTVICQTGEGMLAGVNHVGYDRQATFRMMTEHLIKTGKTCLGFIGSSRTPAGYFNLKFSGFLEALEANRLPYDPRYRISLSDIHQPLLWYKEIADSIQSAVRNKTLSDGYICSSHGIGPVALQALNTAGVKVPEDVALVTMDDLDAADATAPSLTMAIPPRREIGKVAGELLLEIINGSFKEPVYRQVDAVMRVGESVSR